jgi:hypothetical protein
MNSKLIVYNSAKSLRLIFIAALVLGVAIGAKPIQMAYATNSPIVEQSIKTITVEALIDGRSQLILDGNTSQWLQLDFAAPGRWGGRNDPTLINGKEWFPVWPDVPDANNYSCNCYSSIFKGVTPALSSSNIAVELKVIQGRGNVQIIQMPAGKGHPLIVEFDDDAFDGPATYQIELILGHKTNQTVTVDALIDGKSQLILQGNTAQWLHLDFAAPGRLEFQNEPTVINGKEWFPVWPDVPDAENRFCNCTSSIFKGVRPALPQTNMMVTLNVIQGRGDVRIVQMPAASNNYTLIVEFDDDPYGGAEIYKIELSIDFVK